MNSAARSSKSVAEPPYRRLRLLAAWWLPAAVLTGLVTLGAARMAAVSAVALVTEPDVPLAVRAAGLLVGGLVAAVLGRITWRLAIEVPRDLKAWNAALDARRDALKS